MKRMKSLLLLLFSCVPLVVASDGANNDVVVESSTPYIVEQQRGLLLAFYQALGGDSWTENYGWTSLQEEASNANNNNNHDVDYCTWYGVICEGDDENRLPQELLPDTSNEDNEDARRHLQDEEDYELYFSDDAQAPPPRRRLTDSTDVALQPNRPIIGLILRNNYLTGRVPPSLWSWPHLKYLDISFNENLQVTFDAPPSSHHHGSSAGSSLETLKLHNTATETLTGISNVLVNSLHNLHLSQTFLNSVIPNELFQLTNLRKLHLNNCALRGTLPDEVGNLSNLQFFNLFLNDFTGPLPTTLRHLTNLKIWSVGSNSFSGSLTHIFDGEFPNLEQIFFMDNQFTGTVPSFVHVPNLSKIQLADNLLFGTIPDTFLQGVSVTPTSSSGQSHQYGHGQGNEQENNDPSTLYYINLSNNLLSGTIPAALDRLESLNLRLDLRDNKFIEIDQSLCDNYLWNQGDVEFYGCAGIACPIGTYSAVGRQTDDDNCYSCYDGTNYYESLLPAVGMTDCIEQDDRTILTSLYLNTQDNPVLDGNMTTEVSTWENAFGWLHSETDVCDWYGITCGDEDDQEQMSGRVRIIDLSNNGLNGTIPDAIFSLPYLHTLILRNNDVVLPFQQVGISNTLRTIDVSNTHTSQFMGLQHAGDQLEYFYADKIPIRGPIPTQIMALSSLRTLSLAECEIMDELDYDAIQQWRHMRDLYLYGNHLHGTIPHSISSLTNLRVLSLAKNSFTGVIPTGLDYLSSLQALSFKDQKSKGGGLVGPIPSFRYSPNLRDLQLGSNFLSGAIPLHLLQSVGQSDMSTDYAGYTTIDLSDNLFTGVVPSDLAYNFNRLNLYMQKNQIQSLDHSFCGKDDWMNGLVREFSCAAILCPSGSFSQDDSGRHQYWGVPCQACEDDGSSQQMFMGQLNCRNSEESVLEERQVLELLYTSTNGPNWNRQDNWAISTDNNAANNYDYCSWYGITCNERNSITQITLGANNLNGPIPSEIFSLELLEKISLYENANIQFSFTGIEKATHLKSLILDSTGLTSLEGVANARTLNELNVQNNALSGPLTDELYRLVELRSLDISQNQLTGEIPFWFHNLPVLENFVASYNQLGGPIPEFSNFQYLTYLDLSHNDFTGTIPTNFLQSLVDGNNNNENDDYFLSRAENSKVILDLSFNRITGVVPSAIFRQMSHLSIRLIENQITGMDSSLCRVESMNEYDVQYYGCDAILCPIGTSSPIGRQNSNETECTSCDAAIYMGSTACYPSSNSFLRLSSGSTSHYGVSLFLLISTLPLLLWL